MEVSRLGVESELQLPAYATATATWDPSLVFDVHHSSWQHRILNPLSEARDQTHILTDTSQILNLLSYNGNSLFSFLKRVIKGFLKTSQNCIYAITLTWPSNF